MIKGNYVWADSSKTKAVWELNQEGKFIIGCDPYYKPNWWQRILIWFGFMEEKPIKSIVIKLLPNDYVNMKDIKFSKTTPDSYDGSKFKEDV